MRESPRMRRLRTDLAALEHMRADSSILDYEAHGDPPEGYVITFRGKGLALDGGNNIVAVRETHEVSVRLGASYPRAMPELEWMTPIFHPNISGSGLVCLGGYGTHWVPSLNLDELCDMLWDMIRYKNFDVTSPYNHKAAGWAKTQAEYEFPVDPRPLRDKVAQVERPTPPKKPVDEVIFINEDSAPAERSEQEPPDLLIIE